MIWLLPQSLPPSRHQVVSLSQSSCVSLAELTDGRWGVRGWGRSQIIRWHIHIMPESEEQGQKQLVSFSSIFSDQQRLYPVSMYIVQSTTLPFIQYFFQWPTYSMYMSIKWWNISPVHFHPLICVCFLPRRRGLWTWNGGFIKEEYYSWVQYKSGPGGRPSM